MLLSGCVFDLGGNGGESVDLSLYTGALPEPAALPAVTWGPAPEFVGDPSDSSEVESHQAAIEAYIADTEAARIAYSEAYESVIQATRAGGEQSVAAWQSLLVKAGVAVEGADRDLVDIDGVTGFGWPMTDAELRLHAVLATSLGGLRLVDLTDALSGIPELADVDLASALYEDLARARDPGFSEVMLNLGPETLYDRAGQKAIDDVFLSWGQVGVVLRRLSAELAVFDESGSSAAVPGASLTPSDPSVETATAASPRIVMAGGSKKACDLTIDNPWAAELLNQFNKAHATFVFDRGIALIDEAFRDKHGQTGSVGAKVGVARVLSAFATVVAKAAALRAEFVVADSPLVRTKNTQIGEVRDLTLTYRFDEGSWEEIRGCMNLFLTPLGLDIPGSQSGVASNIEIDLASEDPSILRIGDGSGGTTPVTQRTTDANGVAVFTISGAPQADILPEQAQPADIDVTLRAVSNLGANDFYKDMASLPWDALDAVSTAGLSAVPQVLSRMKLITHTGVAPVRDWSLDADFEVTLLGSIESRSASHVEQQNACGGGLIVRANSTEASASFASDPVRVSAVLLSNPDGNLGDTAAVFVPQGEEFRLSDASGGARMFEVPVNYTGTQQHFDPAVGPLPPPRQHPPGGCADGGIPGEYTPPVPDCGTRNYSADATVTMRAPRTLDVVPGYGDVVGDRWENCGGAVSMIPASYECDEPRLSGGAMPSLTELYDPSKSIIEVDGSYSCSEMREGSMTDIDVQWTLVLCRINDDGDAAC